MYSWGHALNYGILDALPEFFCGPVGSKIRADVPKANAAKLTRQTGSGGLAHSQLGSVTLILL
jgi:hypothetical protein